MTLPSRAPEDLYSTSRMHEMLRGDSLTSHHTKGLAIFTICSNNFVSMASILLASAKRFHSDATIYLCLADALLPNEGFYPNDCVLVPIEDLDIPDLRSFVFRYDIMEVNTAVKSFMFQHLFRMGHETVLYFDPDIQIFSRLDQILEPMPRFVLTPLFALLPRVTPFPMTSGSCAQGSIILASLVCMIVPKQSQSSRGGRDGRNTSALAPRMQGSLSTRSSWTSSLASLISPHFARSYGERRVLESSAADIVLLSFEDDTWKVDGRRLASTTSVGLTPSRCQDGSPLEIY